MPEEAPIYDPREWQPGGRFFDLYSSATSYTYPSRVGRIVKHKAAAFVSLDWLDNLCIDVGLSSMRTLDDMLDKDMPRDSAFPDLPDDSAVRLAFFDHCTDLVASPQTPITREGPGWVRPIVWDNAELLRELLQLRTSEDRARVINALRGVGRLSVQKAETSNLDECRDLLIKEGRLVAHWVLGTLGHSGRSPDYVLLNDWAENIGIAGVLVMAAIRLSKSKKAGRAGLADTGDNQASLFGDAFPYLFQSIRQHRASRARMGKR